MHCRLLLTVSEDHSCRIWHAYGGAQLAKIDAHRGRGVWCCSALEGGFLITGGADAALKAWRVSNWLRSSDASALVESLDIRLVGSETGHKEGPNSSGTATTSSLEVRVAVTEILCPLRCCSMKKIKHGTQKHEGRVYNVNFL